jgi:hypothetical protein
MRQRLSVLPKARVTPNSRLSFLHTTKSLIWRLLIFRDVIFGSRFIGRGSKGRRASGTAFWWHKLDVNTNQQKVPEMFAEGYRYWGIPVLDGETSCHGSRSLLSI